MNQEKGSARILIMEIKFLGAVREVTGSCTLVSACGHKILVDCGMEQGIDLYENQDLNIYPNDIDCVLLTHAHIDHSGKLPKLVADGFKGRIYTTTATKKLCEIMLRDSAHIQEFEAQWRNKKAKRSGMDYYQPMYTMKDVENTLPLFVSCSYGYTIKLYDGITVEFQDAGHLLGSASIYLNITENGITKRILFSGDLGNKDRPVIKNPTLPSYADDVIIESTYGNRLHGPREDYVKQFVKIISETIDRGGNVIIPSFAVGRTQEILYLIREIKEKGLLNKYKYLPVWVDSPLAVEATKIYSNALSEFYDEETLKLIKKGVNVLSFDGLCTATTTEESMALNSDSVPKIIISASGMCEAGRIRHHLKHNLWRPECTILFVGYQAEGTLGRIILDGAKLVKIFGEDVQVNARIETINGISGHSDKNMLLDWLKALKIAPERIFVNHGAEQASLDFADSIREELKYTAIVPYPGAEYDLISGECLNKGSHRKVSNKTKGFSAVYQRLLNAVNKLVFVVKKMPGRSNKELEKVTKQIEDIIDKCE